MKKNTQYHLSNVNGTRLYKSVVMPTAQTSGWEYLILWGENSHRALPKLRTLVGPTTEAMHKVLHKQLRAFYYNYGVQFAFRYYL